MMAAVLNPYIGFKDNARAAMEFYRDVFGGELRVNTFGDYGDASTPEADLIMHSQLETASGFTLMGSDTPPGMDYEAGSRVSISLSGRADTDGDELRGYWEKLSADGSVTVPFGKQMWGDEFGMCTDKFGVNWMVNVTAG
jgi:PhnB protein